MYKIGVAAEILGISRSTLRSWTDAGLLDAVVTPTGHRLYDEEDINSLQKQLANGVNKRFVYSACIGYIEDMRGTENEELKALYAQQIIILLRQLNAREMAKFSGMIGRDMISKFNRVTLPITDEMREYMRILSSDSYLGYFQHQLDMGAAI